MEKKKAAARRSSIFDAIRSQLSDAPEELSMGLEAEVGTHERVEEEREKHLRNIEEKMFTRLRDSAREKRLRSDKLFTQNPFSVVCFPLS